MSAAYKDFTSSGRLLKFLITLHLLLLLKLAFASNRCCTRTRLLILLLLLLMGVVGEAFWELLTLNVCRRVERSNELAGTAAFILLFSPIVGTA